MQNNRAAPFSRMVAVGMGLISASSLFGADVFWSGATSRDWHTPSNWSGGSVPAGGDVAVIDPSRQAVTRWDFQLTNAAAVAGLRLTNLTQAVSGSASGNFALTVGADGVGVSGASVMLAFPCVVAAPQTWSVAAGAELVHSGELRGSATLAKAGEGRAWLTGQSVFSGNYRVEAGVLKGVSAYAAPVMDGLDVWLDASASGTFVTNSAGAMTVWSNRVGNSVMTPVGGGGPLWVAHAMRGKPAARFDRAANNGLIMQSGYANTTNVVTAFVVMQRRIDQNAFAGLLSINKDGEMDFNTPNGSVFFRFPNSAPNYTLTCDRNNTQGGEINVPQETPVCLMSRYNGQSHTLVQDGALAGSVSTDTRMAEPFAADRLVLGNRPVAGYAYPFNGDVSEVLVYNRVLTAAEERQVVAYLRQKWQEPGTLETVLGEASLWFDASHPETLVTNEAGGVLTWKSRVSETTLTPVTGANPLFLGQGANGLPAVRFDKDLANSLQTTGGYWNRGKALTVFVSLVPRASQNTFAGVVSVTGWGADFAEAGNACVILAFPEAQRWGAHRQGSWLSSVFLVSEQPAFVMSRFDGGAHTFALNGTVLGAPVASEQTFNANLLRLGARLDGNNFNPPTFNGDIQEVLVYNRALSPAEESLVNGYLDKKWRKADDLGALLADAEVHLDASEAASVVTNEVGQVTAWSNLSSGAVMTVPAVSGCVGPQWVAGAMNGRPVMRFDNTLKTSLFMESGYANTEAGLTAFMVLRRGAMDIFAGVLSAYNAAEPVDYDNLRSAALIETDSTPFSYNWYCNRVVGLGAVADVPFGTPACLMSAFDGLRHTMAVNGGAAASVAFVGNFDANRICVGARPIGGMGYFFSGDVAEVLIYNRSLSAGETARVNAYLREKWQQPATNTLAALLGSAQLWLDASASGTLLTNASGQVTAWSNRVANTAAALIPPAGLTGPTPVAAGLNGRTVLRFDKDAALLQGLMVSEGYALTSASATAVVMMKPRTSQVANARLLMVWRDNANDYDNSDSGIFMYMPAATSCNGFRANNGKSGYGTIVAETPVCLVSRYDGNAHRMIKDGDVLCGPVWSGEGAFNANRLALGFRLNVNEPFNGDIAEVLVFDYALTPDQYGMIVAYLKDKWVNAPSTPVGALQGTQSVEVRSGAELDVRDAAGFAVESGGVLFGAGTVSGNMTVAGGGRIKALGEGDNVLDVVGDLVFKPGATVAIDYAGGARPLVRATGLLSLPAQMTYAATNLIEVTGSATLPVLQGGLWDNGSGGSPSAAAWVLQGGSGAVQLQLDGASHRVNLQIIRGTLLMLF